MFWGLAVLLVLALGGIAGALGGGAAFREILATWGLGMGALLVVVVVGLWLMLHWPRIGILFIGVAGLYIVGWMLKD